MVKRAGIFMSRVVNARQRGIFMWRLKIHNDVTISYELKLTDGVIEMYPSSASGSGPVLTLNDGVEPTGIDPSYIEGPVKKIGNDAYTFPVGRNGHYRPIGIGAPSNTMDAYTARYLNENVHAVHDTSSKEVTLAQISTNDYWTLTRDAGTSNVSVTLSWDDMTCEVTDLTELLVAGWDGTAEEWVDHGSGSTTGTTADGTITSNGNVSDFVAYALATDDEFDCVPCRADAGEDKTIYSTYGTLVGDTAVAGFTYEWSPDYKIDDIAKAMPEVRPRYSLQYLLETTNVNGCEATDDVHIEVIELPNLPQCIGSVGQQ